MPGAFRSRSGLWTAARPGGFNCGEMEMLQVEKRRKKRRGKGRWILIFLAVAAVAVLLAAAVQRETEPVPEREEKGGSLVNRDPSEIARITIQVRGREPWTAERNEEGRLALSGAESWALDPVLGERIEDALANLVYEDILTDEPEAYRDHLEEFGLKDPALTARVFFTDGTEISLRIGDKSGIEDENFRFMTIDGDDRLFAVADSFMEDLQVERDLLHPVEQPEIQADRLDRITVLDAEGKKKAEWILQGLITDADAAASWMVNVPVRYPADQDRISSLKKNIENLRMGLYVGEVTEENLAEYGLDQPQAVLEVHMAAGTTGHVTETGTYSATERPEETLRFIIGKSRNEMTDYVLFGQTVYTINRFTAAAVTEENPTDTAARYPVTVPLETLSRLTIERMDGTKDEYRLDYTIQPAEDGEEGTRRVIVCTKNGQDIDYESFSADYQRWQVATVSGRLPEDWKKQETMIRYTFETLSGKTHVLELSPYDALHDAVTLDGWTLFYLVKNGLGKMI